MKKLILTAILAAILPAYLASAEDPTGNPPDGKPKQGQGKCHGKDGKGKPRKKGKPGEDAQKNVQ